MPFKASALRGRLLGVVALSFRSMANAKDLLVIYSAEILAWFIYPHIKSGLIDSSLGSGRA